MTCPECGTEVGKAKFCTECGKAVSPDAIQSVRRWDDAFTKKQNAQKEASISVEQNEEEEEEDAGVYKRMFKWVGILIVGAAFCAVGMILIFKVFGFN